MKKMFVIFGLLFVIPCFADIGATNGVANSATCDSGALDTDSGGAALEAQYSPETINLHWYDNNTLLNVTSTSSDTCIYDNGINLPANPTKTGYTFKGWKIRPEYDFSTLPTNTNGTVSVARRPDSLVWFGATKVDASNYPDLEPNEWKVEFDWGTIYGMSLCSTTVETTFGTIGAPVETAGMYDWCKVTGYKPSNENIKYRPSNAVPWVFNNRNQVYNSARSCTNHGMLDCAFSVSSNSNFRAALFGQSGS